MSDLWIDLMMFLPFIIFFWALNGWDIEMYIAYRVGGLEHDFFDFPYIGNNNSNGLIYFRGVDPTNQL